MHAAVSTTNVHCLLVGSYVPAIGLAASAESSKMGMKRETTAAPTRPPAIARPKPRNARRLVEAAVMAGASSSSGTR